ncbi:hypothetical protein RhiJN_11444 [Ceratobasidium sp. AG-Ba]|nr:hypothetical protein RhiJN_11444 [Ceratobasidium sp. AG-Ba]QRW12161.1 hypothetical protein RhiLY_11160 [Ceratobasidium sp. AG-Ba]
MQVCQYCRTPPRTPAPLGPYLHLHWQLAAGICRNFPPEFWRILAAGAWHSILKGNEDLSVDMADLILEPLEEDEEWVKLKEEVWGAEAPNGDKVYHPKDTEEF